MNKIRKKHGNCRGNWRITKAATARRWLAKASCHTRNAESQPESQLMLRVQARQLLRRFAEAHLQTGRCCLCKLRAKSSRALAKIHTHMIFVPASSTLRSKSIRLPTLLRGAENARCSRRGSRWSIEHCTTWSAKDA